MSRYVIKNCPALIKEAFQNNQIDGVATTAQISKNLCFGNTCIHCADCTDCKLKQIVELAKGHTELCKNCEQQIKECDCSDICNAYRLDKILKLLDIQECE